MNYLQLALSQAQGGNPGLLTHLGYCIGHEQTKILNFVKKHKFWYVDIPRTSSTSIQLALEKQFGFPYGKGDIPGQGAFISNDESCLLPSHSLAWHVKSVMGDQVWDAIESFSVVRNPYTWSVSLWGYTKKFGDLGLKNDTFKNFLVSFGERVKGPKESRPFFPSSYIQSDYLTDTQGKLLVKNILKFEDRLIIKEFLTDLGCKVNMEENLAVSGESKIEIQPDEKSLIHSIFEKDFDLFSY